ncbi:hypothetical protein GCM10028801_44690 [Nocardioides maradonensis]
MASLVATMLVLGAVAALEAGPASATALSKRALGYAIAKTQYADGGFVGRYVTGTRRGYRIEPHKSAAQSRYRAPVKVANLGGTKAPTPAATSRAAWILSEYGKTKDRSTAAAVDVATYALLRGGRWKLGARYTIRRTNHTGHGSTVRSYARTLIRQATGHAGPYRATLTATTVAAGNQTAVRYKIVNAAGHAPTLSSWAGLPVRFTYPGQTTQVVATNSAGVATAYFTAAAGTTTITAAAKTPESHLLVAKPYNKSASALALVGRTYAARASTSGVGVTAQTVSEHNTAASTWTGRPLAGTYTVTGGTGTRTVDFAIYGPFDSTSVSCSGRTAVWTGTSTISADGTYALPTAWSPAKSGYYVWSVAVEANVSSTAASTCGAAYPARHATTTKQARHGTVTSVTTGARFGPDVTISGFDRTEAHSLATRVYGPFTDKTKAKCYSGKLLKTISRSVSGNGTYTQRTTVSKTGWFIFASTLGNGPLIGGSTSSCGIPTRVTS